MKLCELLGSLVFASSCWPILAASSQGLLGNSFGIPNNSPPVLWPRGMSIEALSPNNLYPNGPQFGLSNTSGGFGMSGSGPISGVGLAQRSVSNLVQEELARPYANLRRLSSLENAASNRSIGLFSAVLGNQFQSELTHQGKFVGESHLITGSSSASAIGTDIVISSTCSLDNILQDRPSTTNDILKTGL